MPPRWGRHGRPASGRVAASGVWQGSGAGASDRWLLGRGVPNAGIGEAGRQGSADRFKHRPHMGWVVALVWGGNAILTKARCPLWLSAGLCSGVILVLALLSWQQVWHWRGSVTLFTHIASITIGRAHV